MKEYISIGKLVATHGLTGTLILSHSLGKKSTLKGLEALFIEEDKDKFIPYFIESATAHKHTEVLLKIEGIDSKEAAKKLYPKTVWIQKEDFKRLTAKANPVNLLNYDMVHKDEILGKIEEIIEQPHQLLCVLIINGKETLIPIHSDNLIKIDHKAQKVFVELPDGLLEIYQ